jgi:thiol-disulfide isomerase/thioredoxin
MRYLLTAVLYTALATTANADIAALEGLRTGDMRKLQFHSEITKAPEVAFIRADGSEGVLSDYSGKVVVLNFWATWCAPCRKEMPELSALQTDLGGDDFEVVTVATGRNPLPAMQKFFDQIDIDNLPLHTDARQSFARSMGVLGLPVTLIMDPEGNEIARLQGEADWHSESAVAIITALIAPD